MVACILFLKILSMGVPYQRTGVHRFANPGISQAFRQSFSGVSSNLEWALGGIDGFQANLLKN
jgi:hypothetical protein